MTLVEDLHSTPSYPCREVMGLAWAEWRSKGPWPKARGRTPSQKKGLRYERKFGLHLNRNQSYSVRSGTWIEFLDETGPGWAQPDHVLMLPKSVWIFENKLTYRESAWDQLELLYGPLVREIVGSTLPIGLVQVTKNLGGTEWQAMDGGRPVMLENLERLDGGLLGSTNSVSPRFLYHWLGV